MQRLRAHGRDRAKRGLATRLFLAAVSLGLLGTPQLARADADDLQITVATSNATPVNGGAAYAYTVTLTNPSQSVDATDVVMSLTLPQGIVFLNLSITENNPSLPDAPTVRGNFACVAPPGGVSGLVECRAPVFPRSSVSTTSTAAFTIVVQSRPDQASGVRTATARVVANGEARIGSVPVNLQVDAPLSVSLAGPASAARGSTAVYRLTLNNGGSSTTLNSTVRVALPASLTFFSLSGTGPFQSGCSVTPAGLVDCVAIDVPTGLHYLTLVARVGANAPLGNLAVPSEIFLPGTGSIAVGTSTANTTIVAP